MYFCFYLKGHSSQSRALQSGLGALPLQCQHLWSRRGHRKYSHQGQPQWGSQHQIHCEYIYQASLSFSEKLFFYNICCLSSCIPSPASEELCRSYYFFLPIWFGSKIDFFLSPRSWRLLLMMTGSQWSPIKPWWKLPSCSPLPFPSSLRRSTGKCSFRTFRTALSDRRKKISHDNIAVSQKRLFSLAKQIRVGRVWAWFLIIGAIKPGVTNTAHISGSCFVRNASENSESPECL